MPVVPSSAYVSMETVMNLIRSIINDVIYSQAGELFTDNANFTLPFLNDSLEWFTNEVNNHGVETFTKETTLTPLTPTPGAASTDPATQANIGDNGYFDGVGINMGPQLQLPPDLLAPEFMWERQTGSQENWLEMRELLGGLPSQQPRDRFQIWEWRTDQIWMPGCTQSNDARLRYSGSLATFVSTGDTLYFRGAVGPLAYKTVSAYLMSRNPAASEVAAKEANLRISHIFSRNARMKQGHTTTRRSYGRQDRTRTFIPPRNP